MPVVSEFPPRLSGVDIAAPFTWLANLTSWQVAADVLWTGFGLCLLAIVVALLAVRHGFLRLAWVLLFVSTAGTLYFSFLSGFSIGRFTAAIPVLTTAYALGIGRGAKATVVFLAAGVAVYVAGSWVLTPLEFGGGLLAWLFGGWAIATYAVLALLVFGWTAARVTRIAAADG
jgi:hypothetical protein